MTIGQRSTLSGDPVAVPGLERAVPDLSIAATDRPLRPGQYVYVETHAWWLTTHGPHQLLAEHRLPRDPDTLVQRLRDENTGSWFGPFAAGVTALRTCLVPADLRAAMCLALACLPGVRAVEGIENVDGVACLALVHDAGRTRTELMLSPVDGQFAGERDT